jgi:hypothetical protein
MSATTKPVKRWAPEIIELAYQTWAGAADRNVAETVRRLTDQGIGTIPDSTISHWRDVGNWEGRRLLEVSGVATVPAELHVNELSVAAIPAIRYLDQVARGTVKPDRDRIAVCQHLETAARSLILQAAKQDGRRKPVPQRAGSPVNLPTDPTELEALEARRREQRG